MSSPAVSNSGRRLARASSAALLVATLVGIASCGSRTGLFGIGSEGLTPEGGAPDGFVPDAPIDGPIACTPGRFGFERAVAQLMFVVDRSGSMALALDGTQPDPQGHLPPGVPSRWEVLRDGLLIAITPFDATIAMGAKFYPEEASAVDDGCGTDVGVGIAPATGNVSTILKVFDATAPLGGTPTSEALRLAAQYLTGARGIARTIVLATDGAPNCNAALNQNTCVCTARRSDGTEACKGSPDGENCLDNVRTVAVVKSIFDDQKIPVYVIGIGGDERADFLAVLDEMAVAGGRPKPGVPRHYSVQTPDEMNDALSTISSSVAQCTYLTPSAPTNPDAIVVEIDGRVIPRDPLHRDGWDWVDQAYGSLAFFGNACDGASRAGAEVAGVVHCDK